MSQPFQEMARLSKLIHEPARLAIVSALSACQAADFVFLRRLTGLSKGNLSNHLSRLEEGGIVEIRKEFVGKAPRTVVSLTEAGRRSAMAYWEQLERLKREAVRWRPEAVTTP
ncbi:MAG: transcriptional regulator [Trueperaceae bacterium]